MHSEDVRINPAEAKARVDSGEAIILDVVAPQVWQQMQRAIVGAIRIDPREIEHRYHELPLNRQIIAYCTGPDEGTSARVALYLREQGYRAFALRGGYQAWRAAGYPTEPKEVEVSATLVDVCPECQAAVVDHRAGALKLQKVASEMGGYSGM